MEVHNISAFKLLISLLMTDTSLRGQQILTNII